MITGFIWEVVMSAARVVVGREGGGGTKGCDYCMIECSAVTKNLINCLADRNTPPSTYLNI